MTIMMENKLKTTENKLKTTYKDALTEYRGNTNLKMRENPFKIQNINKHLYN